MIETFIFAAAGLGLQALGASKSAKAAKEQAAASAEIARQEQLIEAQKRQAMILQNQRGRLEAVRNLQRARASALTTATSQGAAQGSALGGAYGQLAGQFGTNVLAESQNFQIGSNIFDINSQISQQKIRLAQAGGEAATGTGFSSLGSSILGSSQQLGALTAGFGKIYTPIGGSKYNQPGGYGYIG